jgi:hypothetical protein
MRSLRRQGSHRSRGQLLRGQRGPDLGGSAGKVALSTGKPQQGFDPISGQPAAQVWAMVWRARLSCRSPDLFSRCRVMVPDDASMGAAPPELGGLRIYPWYEF